MDCFSKLNQRGTAGTDGVTMSEFKANLEHNVEEIYTELRTARYSATSVRRVYIPKANGKLRPLGIPTVKDRLVQRAVGGIISTIYEPYFLDVSYGFRPGRSAHDALETLRKIINKKKIRYVVEADIKSYFDKVNHDWLMKFLGHRIADSVILRLVKKWLKAGYMERGVVSRTEEGTPQGGPISPLLANIYLHYVLDLWFEKKFKMTCKGNAEMVRYADDFVVCFERKDEADRFQMEMADRFAAFNLELSEEKTVCIEFGATASCNGMKGSSGFQRTFDFLGFTHYMRKRRYGFRVGVKPSRTSRNRFLKNTKEWLKENREKSVWYQGYRLRKKLFGCYNYFGLRNCQPALRHVKYHVVRLWLISLRRRSQRHCLWWHVFLKKPWVRLLPNP
jgi:RNA-directed DNA polymerase